MIRQKLAALVARALEEARTSGQLTSGQFPKS